MLNMTGKNSNGSQYRNLMFVGYPIYIRKWFAVFIIINALLS